MRPSLAKFSIFPAPNAASTKRIIQCPACQTKFAIASSVLQSVESPRFHCSRCDHLFADGSVKSDIVEAKPDDVAWERRRDDSSIKSPVNDQLTGEIVEFKEPSPLPPAEDQDKVGFPGDLKPQEDDRVSNLDSSNEDDDTLVAPPAAWLNPLRVLKQDPASESTKTADPGNNEIIPAVSSSAILGNDAPPEVDQPENIIYKAKNQLRRAIQVPLPFAGFSPRNQKSPKDSNLPKVLNPWNSFLCAALPCGVLLLLLGMACLTIKGLGTSSKSYFAYLFPVDRRGPPAGLQLRGTNLENVQLENGQFIQVLRGSISNQSTETISDVLIEAGLYGRTGEVVSTQRWWLIHTLNNNDLRNLSMQSLNELQSGKLGAETDKRYLKPGATKSFIFALPLHKRDSQTPKFYSARVHSVR